MNSSFNSFGWMPRSTIARSYGESVQFCKTLQSCPLRWLHHPAFPSAVREFLLLLHLTPAVGGITFGRGDSGHSNSWIVAPPCCFKIFLKKEKQLRTVFVSWSTPECMSSVKWINVNVTPPSLTSYSPKQKKGRGMLITKESLLLKLIEYVWEMSHM